jgi:hypothetical protein
VTYSLSNDAGWPFAINASTGVDHGGRRDLLDYESGEQPQRDGAGEQQ